MFTSFFNLMQDKQVLNLNLMRKGEKLIVSFQPLSSNETGASGSNLSPLVVTATPAELDAGFIPAISTPMKERFDMIINLDAFKESTKKATPKPGGKPEVTVLDGAGTKSGDKKTKTEQQIEEAEKLFKAGNLPAAHGAYKKLYEQDKTNTKVGNRMHEIWALMSQKHIFGPASEENNGKPAQDNVQATIVAEDNRPVAEGHTMAPEIISKVETPVPAAEEEKPVTDMFAQIINQGKIQVEETVVKQPEEKEAEVILPPGMTFGQYQQFLAFQQYQKQMEGAAITV